MWSDIVIIRMSNSGLSRTIQLIISYELSTLINSPVYQQQTDNRLIYVIEYEFHKLQTNWLFCWV